MMFLNLTQSDRNFPGIFIECSLSVAIFRTSREHLGKVLKEKFFKNVVFVLKVYNLIITNADLWKNYSNHEVMPAEYSRDIPRMWSVSKLFQVYPRNIVKLWKNFCRSKSSQNCFLGYPVKILILVVSSLAMSL